MKNIRIFVTTKLLIGTVVRKFMLTDIFHVSIVIMLRQFTPCIRCNGVCNPSQKEVLSAGSKLPFIFQLTSILNSFKNDKNK